MDIKDKIQQYLDFKGIKVTQFENSIGASSGYWRKTKSISANIVSQIAGIYTDLNIEWVFIDKGAMLKSDASHTDHTKESIVIDMAQDSSSIYERMIEKKDKRIEELALMVGNLQKEVEMLKQDKKTVQEESDASNAVERLRLTGTDDR